MKYENDEELLLYWSFEELQKVKQKIKEGIDFIKMSQGLEDTELFKTFQQKNPDHEVIYVHGNPHFCKFDNKKAKQRLLQIKEDRFNDNVKKLMYINKEQIELIHEIDTLQDEVNKNE